MTLFSVRTQVVRLAIMPRPRGRDWLTDDLKSIKQEGIDVVVSALTADESEELGLTQEAACCRENGINFVSFPIEDRSVPESVNDFHALLDHVQAYLSSGRKVAVHCRAGIGRSSIIAAGLLLRNGFSVAGVFQALEEARGLPVPDTPEQRAWIERLAIDTETAGTM